MNHKTVTSLDISRVVRSKRDAQVTYDRMSRWYDILAGSEQRFTEFGIAKLKPALGEKILEIGYGTGHALVKFAEAIGDSGTVLGIDISEGMRARGGPATDRTRGNVVTCGTECGDATALPFGSGLFDANFMSFTLELFDTPEIPLVLKECLRVLTSSGRICVVALAKEEREG